MGRVTLHFSEEDYKLFHHYCANYIRLYDDTRKNAIKILLELYKHQIIDFQEDSLDNVYAFFYQKKQVFETEFRVLTTGANEMMRIRMCSDIISFLGDMEKIYILLRSKGVKANYFFIIGAFSKIFDDENQMHREEIQNAASGVISSIVLPLGDAIEKKLGLDVDTLTLLKELVNFAGTFNRISPDPIFNDEIIEIIAFSLFKRFKKEKNYDELKTLLNDHRNQFVIDEFESALEGGLHAQTEWGLEFPWEDLKKPLIELNEMINKSHNRMLVPLDVLSALEAPMTVKPSQAESSQLTLYQNPGMVRKGNDENLFLVKVDNYAKSEVSFSYTPDSISPELSKEEKYKKYFSITAGVSIIFIILLAGIIFSIYSSPVNQVGTPTGVLIVSKIGTIAHSTVNLTLIQPQPTPTPTPNYFTIETIAPEPDIGPKSNQEALNNLPLVPNTLYDPKDYITILKNNLTYDNPIKISFDLKNPPMVIRYTVFPLFINYSVWFTPRDAHKKIDTAIIYRPDDATWFKVDIYNKGELEDEEGWGNQYDSPLTQQEIVIRKPGMTQIELSSNEVYVNLEVLVKKEGNIDSSANQEGNSSSIIGNTSGTRT
jgi:hypothetical protein